MKRTIKSVIIFCLGAGIGAGVFYLIYKPIRDKKEDEDVESVKETFKSDFEKNPGSDFSDFVPVGREETDEDEEADKEIFYADMTEKYRAKTADSYKSPYVISPVEFGSLDEYDQESFTYYADGIVTDDNDEIVDNINELVGADFADHFGEYEEDSVYIRNEKYQTDYEILYDMKTYTEMHEPVFT